MSIAEMSYRQNNLEIALLNAHSALRGQLNNDLGNPATFKKLL